MNLEDRLADAASTFDAAIEAQMAGLVPARSRPHWHRGVAAAAAVLVTAAAVPLIAKFGDRDDEPEVAGPLAAEPSVVPSSLVVVGLPPSTQAVVVESTEAPLVTSHLVQPLGYGSVGGQVRDV